MEHFNLDAIQRGADDNSATAPSDKAHSVSLRQFLQQACRLQQQFVALALSMFNILDALSRFAEHPF
jgi:hypothetical protein